MSRLVAAPADDTEFTRELVLLPQTMPASPASPGLASRDLGLLVYFFN